MCLFSHLASGESTFGELFGEAAAKYEMLCIGLYRLVKILRKIIFSQGFLHAHKEACAKVPWAFLSHFCCKVWCQGLISLPQFQSFERNTLV